MAAEDEYLIDLNATQAAIRAGYKAKNAQQVGSENLSKLVIAEAISEKTADQQATTESKLLYSILFRVLPMSLLEVSYNLSHTHNRVNIQDKQPKLKVSYNTC